MQKKMFNFPIKTFDQNNLLDEMMRAKEGEVFVLGEKITQNKEGDATVELTIVQIKKVTSN